MTEKDLFLTGVVAAMRDHPEWTPDVFKAVQAGAEEAVEALRKRAAVAEQGLLAALVLTGSKRLSVDLTKSLNTMLLRTVNPREVSGLSPFERDAYAKAFGAVRDDKPKGQPK